MEDEDDEVERTVKWLEGLSIGVSKHEFRSLTPRGLRVVRARKHSFLCTFVVPGQLSDRDGNWHVGAMAALIEDDGAATVYSTTGTGYLEATLDLCVSYLSTAKIQEEVEMESEVEVEVRPGSEGKLVLVLVEVRREGDGELIALAKRWWVSLNLTSDHQLL